MDLITHYEFDSDCFPPDPGEEETINPGCYGKKLANFVCAGLSNHGYRAGTPFAEDWGWIVPVKNLGFNIWVGCGASQDHENAFLCYVHPHKPSIFHFFKRKKVESEIIKLSRTLKSVLSYDGISKLREITYVQCMTGA